MRISQICMAHKYCTDCPSRKECTVRPIFYSQSEYDEMIGEMRMVTSRATAFMGIPPYMANFQIEQSIQMMHTRRDRELTLHPTYSKD